MVIFDENISFDHYFATYPRALNPVGEPAFTAAANTPYQRTDTGMLQRNPNPRSRFASTAAGVTCDNDNHYTDEQTAYHAGLLDKVAETRAPPAPAALRRSMGYYDGNTVTAYGTMRSTSPER